MNGVQTISEDRIDFATAEMFFSRTDERGVILAGNSVFRRISGFRWDEMRNAPHKIVRHPDMPKAVFWLMWDRLKRGLPVGAYVKNRTKSGGHYWVYAMVTPIEGGYLSVRQRPEAGDLSAVEDLYAAIRAREREGDVDAAASARHLLDALAGRGARNYGHFMALSAVQETLARDEVMGRAPSPDVRNLSGLIDTASEMLGKAADVQEKFRHIRAFPINLGIQSSRLAGVGQLFGAISGDYARFCKSIESKLGTFLEGTTEVADRMAEAAFRFCAARAQAEMADLFAGEASGNDDLAGEIARLRDQAAAFRASTAEALSETEATAHAFGRVNGDVNWLVGGLDVVRTLGMIETSRLHEQGATLHKMMAEAAAFGAQILDQLAVLKDLNDTVLHHTEEMARSF